MAFLAKARLSMGSAVSEPDGGRLAESLGLEISLALGASLAAPHHHVDKY